MWLRKDLLVPRLAGVPYDDKPPLLFWALDLGWAVAGVNAWWPRLVPFLFTLGAVFLTARLARALWPERLAERATAPLLLVGTPFWALYGTFLLCDMPLVFFVLSALLGLWIASGALDTGTAGPDGPSHRMGWLLFAAGIGFGALAKGPVVLLHTLPVALLAPWWARRAARAQEEAPPPALATLGPGGGEESHARRGGWVGWYAATTVALLLGAGLALAWALPAAAAGGPRYGSEILWGQTAGRVLQSFAHRRPWWWYAPLGPLVFFPWLLWPPLWRSLGRLRQRGLDAGARFCVSWVVSGFVLLSAVSGKQPHYLLPLLPGLALLSARALAAEPKPPRPRAALWPLGVLALAGLVVAALPELWPDAAFGRAPFWVGQVSPVWGLAIVGVAAACGLAVRRAPSARAQARQLAIAGVAAMVLVQLGPSRKASPGYDVSPLARHLAVLERDRVPVANLGDYAGQYDFLGRLGRPPEALTSTEVLGWMDAHPDGRMVVYYREWRPASALPGGLEYAAAKERPPSAPRGGGTESPSGRPAASGFSGSPGARLPRPELAQAYRGHAAAVWAVTVLRAHPELLERMP